MSDDKRQKTAAPAGTGQSAPPAGSKPAGPDKSTAPAGPYDDIIHLSRPISTKHRPMAMKDRAAQFAPFAALTGYDEEIRETARLTDAKMVLSEDKIEELDRSLAAATAAADINGRPKVKITYFEPDLLKEGGEYLDAIGKIAKLYRMKGQIIMESGMAIPIEDIIDIQTVD